mmetsp:Transcript_16971/g.40631  ORF Transcript_16971/g.40631 Transcript_16971/m.40631 type:complete len:105 (-) Transcript_16971:619-933(-)
MSFSLFLQQLTLQSSCRLCTSIGPRRLVNASSVCSPSFGGGIIVACFPSAMGDHLEDEQEITCPATGRSKSKATPWWTAYSQANDSLTLRTGQHTRKAYEKHAK